MLEILGTIGFDWKVALSNLISFLIIFFILKKYVFGPLGKTIEERQKKIKLGLEKAEQSKETLLQAQEEAKEEIQKARREANEIIAEAKKKSDELVLRASEEAQNKAEEIKETMEKKIENQKKKMEQELLEKTAGLVTLGVTKILGDSINDEQNKSLNEKAINSLKNL